MALRTAQRSHATIPSLLYLLGQCPRRGHRANCCIRGTWGLVVRRAGRMDDMGTAVFGKCNLPKYSPS